jgi:hypothetical protein
VQKSVVLSPGLWFRVSVLRVCKSQVHGSGCSGIVVVLPTVGLQCRDEKALVLVQTVRFMVQLLGQRVPADHQLQLVPGLGDQGDSQAAVKVSGTHVVHLQHQGKWMFIRLKFSHSLASCSVIH